MTPTRQLCKSVIIFFLKSCSADHVLVNFYCTHVRLEKIIKQAIHDINNVLSNCIIFTF